MVQRTSEKISELGDAPVLEQDFVIPVSDPNVASYKVRKDRLEPRFNVLDYGAVGTASTLASTVATAFAAADAAAALVGGTVYVPKGTYGNGTAWTYVMSSGVTLEGDGDLSILVNVRLTCTGTLGSEIPFTAPAVVGAATISIPATGLTGSWLRIASVINCGSTDAGIEQLGDTPADMSFLAEFVRVKTGNAGTADLYRHTNFSYSNTAGGDSGSFTTSVASVVTFHQGARIRRLKFLGKGSAENDIIRARWCRDLVIEDCAVDSNDLTAQNIRLEYSLNCHVRRGTITGKLTSVPAGSSANQLIIASCQECTANDVTFEGGNQCVDVTYMLVSAQRGGPSINCGAVNCRAYNMATEGFTDHQGCWRSFFRNCDASGSVQGFRIRSRGTVVQDCRMASRLGSGAGVKIQGAALLSCDVSRNRIDGFVYGVEYDTTQTGYTALRALLAQGDAVIQANTIANTSNEGIFTATSPALATMIGPRILDNIVRSPGGHGIEIRSYVNGARVERNQVTGIASGKRGILWNANVKRLWVADNSVFSVDAAGFGMGGNSVVSLLTDAVTFPAGDAEAQLYLGNLFTDAAAPTTSILRVPAGYLQPVTAGFGGGTLVASTVLRGAGSPESIVYAPIGTLYLRSDGGASTSVYVKEANATLATGWVAK